MKSNCNVSLLINHQVYIWMLTIILYIYPSIYLLSYIRQVVWQRLHYLKQNVRWLVLYIYNDNPTTNKRRQKYWNVIVCGVYTKLLLRFRIWWWEFRKWGVLLNVFTQLIYKTHLNYTLSFVSFHSIYKPLLLHLNFTILLFQWHSFYSFIFPLCTNAFNTLISASSCALEKNNFSVKFLFFFFVSEKFLVSG